MKKLILISEITKLYKRQKLSHDVDDRTLLGIHPDDKRNYYFKNGQLVLKHGQFEMYHDNGNLCSKGCYQDGHTIGAWQYYYASGQIMQRGFYVSNGRRLGIKDYGDTWEHYNEDGTLEFFCEKWKTIQERLNKVSG